MKLRIFKDFGTEAYLSVNGARSRPIANEEIIFVDAKRITVSDSPVIPAVVAVHIEEVELDEVKRV